MFAGTEASWHRTACMQSIKFFSTQNRWYTHKCALRMVHTHAEPELCARIACKSTFFFVLTLSIEDVTPKSENRLSHCVVFTIGDNIMESLLFLNMWLYQKSSHRDINKTLSQIISYFNPEGLQSLSLHFSKLWTLLLLHKIQANRTKDIFLWTDIEWAV